MIASAIPCVCPLTVLRFCPCRKRRRRPAQSTRCLVVHGFPTRSIALTKFDDHRKCRLAPAAGPSAHAASSHPCRKHDRRPRDTSYICGFAAFRRDPKHRVRGVSGISERIFSKGHTITFFPDAFYREFPPLHPSSTILVNRKKPPRRASFYVYAGWFACVPAQQATTYVKVLRFAGRAPRAQEYP